MYVSASGQYIFVKNLLMKLVSYLIEMNSINQPIYKNWNKVYEKTILIYTILRYEENIRS